MIIALEGVPAAGKTTAAGYLVSHRGALRVPEVNESFLRPDPESVTWYLQRQIDRLARATRDDGPGRLVILDGDPYQPLWFAWLYPDRVELPWHEVLTFFHDRQAGLAIPHFYVYLEVAPEERRRREERRARARGHDRARVAAKVRRYESMRGPHRAFFAALDAAFPGLVVTCQAQAPEEVADCVLGHLPPVPASTAAVLAFMRGWFASRAPAQFR